jgi:hypothetical protein
MTWSAYNIAARMLHKQSRDEITLDAARKREEKREAFLCKLTRWHADRWNLSETIAREHINALSITARCAVRDELGLD